MKMEGAESEDIFDSLFDVGVEKFLLEKYLLEFLEEYDSKHLNQIDEDFDDHPDNDGLKNIIRDKGMQNLNNDN